MSGDSPEQIRKETRVYVTVFVALAALTIITVAVSYLHLSGWRAIGLALFIAGVKGFLVAGYFMHLLSEKKLIYTILAFTVVFFGMLLWIPHVEKDGFGTVQRDEVTVPEGEH
ncbi:MAG TPA: cytochrome C oxidase subunit IV family protein [Thermoanaerobaculia bacterium]|nr:cytochrome C oxidase subunit IV family protein [Thermoanaerobaculia bacterium]